MTEKNNKVKIVTIRLTEDWHMKLKKLSEEKQLPMSILVRQAIMEYIDKQ